MITSFGFQLVCVSGPTSVLRIRVTVVKELNVTFYRVDVPFNSLTTVNFTRSFLHQECWSPSRHATLNSLIKQTLGSLDLPSVLEPRGLFRTVGKRPDGVAMIPWEMGKQLVWDITVVDALAPSRLGDLKHVEKSSRKRSTKLRSKESARSHPIEKF